MWELGYAMAMGKPTILIGQSTEALPFDLKIHRVLAYDPAISEDSMQRVTLVGTRNHRYLERRLVQQLSAADGTRARRAALEPS